MIRGSTPKKRGTCVTSCGVALRRKGRSMTLVGLGRRDPWRSIGRHIRATSSMVLNTSYFLRQMEAQCFASCCLETFFIAYRLPPELLDRWDLLGYSTRVNAR